MTPTHLLSISLLLISNVFMTFAWYGHLRFKDSPLLLAILASWGLAFAEYCFQVPANRLGHGVMTAPQLKALQEGITFFVFACFSTWYLKESPTRWDYAAFVLIGSGVCLSLMQPGKAG